MTPEQHIAQLREELRRHEHAYYIMSAPTISDVEYDALLRELEQLEREHPECYDPDSPTQRVGSDLASGDRAVSHLRPMLSLSNTYTSGELAAFVKRIEGDLGRTGGVDIVTELKYDGVSISIIYEGGHLVRAVTRGDGMQGDEVTAAVRAIRSIPLVLHGDHLPVGQIEVRGEIVLPWREFERINSEKISLGELPFANPRNAVSGTIKQLSPRVVAHRKPEAIFYFLYSDDEGWLPTTHYGRLERLQEMGLKTSPHTRLCHTTEEVLGYIEQWAEGRHTLDIATDGVVLKVNDCTLYDQLGYTAKAPRWAFAYKYPAEEAVTTLESVDYQVGRTGVVTPVANLKEVHISGTMVRRASLHNGSFIKELDLHLGDQVTVIKGGEIIPKITGVRLDMRAQVDPNTLIPITMPTHCPVCGTLLQQEEGEAALYCPNDVSCAPQIIAKIEHFCGRKAMNINIGPETITELYQRGMVRDVAGLYALMPMQILSLPLFQQKSAMKLYESIAKSVETPFERVLFALGIRHVGESLARDLARHAGSIERLQEMTEEQLTSINGVGSRIASSVRAYFDDPRHRAIIDALRAAGVQLQCSSDTAISEEGASTLLEGAVIVVSGVFATIERDTLKELIARHGGKVASSISSKTTFMLIGDNVGPAKLQKAELLGIPLVREDEFFARYPIHPSI